jgi:CBS domain-containing protein
MKGITAADIMDRSELTLSPDLGIDTAMDRMLRSKLTGAAVVDERGLLLGMLTEKDCLRALVSEAIEGAPGGPVRNYMSSPAESVTPQTILLDIVGLFLDRPYRKLPVVDGDGRVVGQVSRRDILRGIKSVADNSFLYGKQHLRPKETSGVHSAMERARGKQ